MVLSSEYRSSRLLQTPLIKSRSSSSLIPDLMGPLRSVPWLANRQVYSLPSVESLALVQSPQKGLVTEAIVPISPVPSTYL